MLCGPEGSQIQGVESKKLRHKLAGEFLELNIHIRMEDTPTEKDRARLRPVQGKSASSWLEAIPTEELN